MAEPGPAPLAAASDLVARVRFGADGLVPAVVQDAGDGRVLTQAWMSRESYDETLRTAEHADSQIEVVLDATPAGTRVTLKHSGVPADQLGYERGGWDDSYFAPMREYFAR